jgi:exosortase
MKSITVWFVLTTLALIIWLLVDNPSLAGHLTILIWLATAAIVINLSKKAKRKLSGNEKLIAIFFGILICIFSFTNGQMGIGNPGYHVGDFSVLLSGVTLILLVVLDYRELLLPSIIPFVAYVLFHIYDKMRSSFEVIGAPLEIPVVWISIFILNLLGVGAYSLGNVIMITTKAGEMLQIPIVFDCTGVESMGAYLLTAGIIFYYFRKMPRDKNIIFLVVGIVGTYLANILRVVAICITGYYEGYGAVTETAHVNLGWVIFSIWMLIYWTAFFFTYKKFEKSKGIYSKNEQK